MALFAFYHFTLSLKAPRVYRGGNVISLRLSFPRTQIIMNFYDQPINVCRRGIMKQCKMLRNKLIMIKVIIWLLCSWRRGLSGRNLMKMYVNWRCHLYVFGCKQRKCLCCSIFHNLVWSLDAIACNNLTKVTIWSETATPARTCLLNSIRQRINWKCRVCDEQPSESSVRKVAECRKVSHHSR